MAKLGYTWYPKDWKTNEKVFNLSLELRGFYREFIDFAYENDNKFTINHKYWCRMLDINKRKFDTLFARLIVSELIITKDDICYIPSVEPRIQLIRGGKKGGEKSKPAPKLDDKPTLKQTEKETKRETKRETKTIKERKAEFQNSLLPFMEKIDADILVGFFDYWTEHGEKDKKMRFEKEKSFGISRRLSIWVKNQEKWKKEKGTPEKEKIVAGRQTLDTINKNKQGWSI